MAQKNQPDRHTRDMHRGYAIGFVVFILVLFTQGQAHFDAELGETFFSASYQESSVDPDLSIYLQEDPFGFGNKHDLGGIYNPLGDSSNDGCKLNDDGTDCVAGGPGTCNETCLMKHDGGCWCGKR